VKEGEENIGVDEDVQIHGPPAEFGMTEYIPEGAPS
jgi:hypothetical protein